MMLSMKEIIARRMLRIKGKAESPLEENILFLMENFKGLDYQAQYWINKYRIDLAIPKYKLGLEIDGEAYHNKEKDLNRDIKLRSFGWVIERVPGWFCYRYPKATIFKLLRHVPEAKDYPFYQECEHQAKLWAESNKI